MEQKKTRGVTLKHQDVSNARAVFPKKMPSNHLLSACGKLVKQNTDESLQGCVYTLDLKVWDVAADFW